MAALDVSPPIAASPRPALSRPQRWLATAFATVCATYLIDAIATVSGMLLVASGLLAAAPDVLLATFLATTYLVWGLALRVNLRANLALLEETGASTSLVSKAAHDLARRMTASRRAARLAAAVGYVGTEIVKELPYYLGAFGMLMLTQ